MAVSSELFAPGIGTSYRPGPHSADLGALLLLTRLEANFKFQMTSENPRYAASHSANARQYGGAV